MHIIFGQDQLNELESKYTVLELDTVRIPGQAEPITAYCVVEHIPLAELSNLENYKSLHSKLLKNYRLKNWKFCKDALEHLQGKWNREVDSFYKEIGDRIQKLETDGVSDNWDGIIDRTMGTGV